MMRSSLFMETYDSQLSPQHKIMNDDSKALKGTLSKERGDNFLFSYDHLSCTQELV